ncbi:MAG: FKBP-type peptidyl-prolyl cis-trans isomerase, partial [Ectothiorhodospiraceae bacterium]|nr:FKBP-type peptidyl-prolyl cis-trans isomerase [Ectothiorhodospiraceae bacterium]
DNSHRRGEPVTFALDGTIAGWAEGLQRLPVGSRARLVIPHWLGYGANGAPPAIGANETLVFEVELLAILPREGWNP